MNSTNFKKPLQLGIMATTFTGNYGAAAMLNVCIEQTKLRYPAADIHVLTYSPENDARWCQDRPQENVWLHSSTPATIAIRWFPLALIFKCLPFLKRPLRKQNGEGISRLLDLDAVVDFAGVSFMDGREKFLPFNVLTLFPFLLHGVPVIKLSQAIGPITSPPNRFCARWILPRLSYLAARGRKTVEYLKDFGLPEANWNYAPDTAFLLQLEENPKPVSERQGIVFMPSSLMLKKDPNYPELLIETIKRLRQEGHSISILAHSWKDNSELPRNNDFPLCQTIHKALGSPKDIQLYGPGLDARALKQVVSEHRIAVTSRFHGMIAALDSETPVWVLGWSHKYREVLAEFDLTECAVKADLLNPNTLSQLLHEGYNKAEPIAEKITHNLGRVRSQCAAQFERLFKIIEKND